jgi:hypothetical protein
VFTNFPDFAFVRPILREMVRVCRPGGKVMVGQVPDEEKREELQRLAQRIGEELTQQHGPVQHPQPSSSPWARLRRWVRRRPGVAPAVVCYDFRRSDFLDFAAEAEVSAELHELPASDPYRGARFNVVYTKGSA